MAGELSHGPKTRRRDEQIQTRSVADPGGAPPVCACSLGADDGTHHGVAQRRSGCRASRRDGDPDRAGAAGRPDAGHRSGRRVPVHERAARALQGEDRDVRLQDDRTVGRPGWPRSRRRSRADDAGGGPRRDGDGQLHVADRRHDQHGDRRQRQRGPLRAAPGSPRHATRSRASHRGRPRTASGRRCSGPPARKTSTSSRA